jgi:hypothetical protein
MNIRTFFRSLPAQLAFWFVLFLTVYGVFVQYWHPRFAITGQHIIDSNTITIERLIYGEKSDVFLVGTSISGLLPPDSFGTNICNVHLQGRAPVDGLAILRDAGIYPRILIIEMNLAAKTCDVEFVRRWQKRSPALESIRKRFYVFRTEFNPVNLLIGTLTKVASSKEYSEQGARKKVNLDLQSILIRQAGVVPECQEENLSRLRELVCFFRDNGATVILCDMPISAALRNVPAQRSMYERIRSSFTEAEFRWVLFDDNAFTTSDGVHLLEKDARRVGEKIWEVIKGF